MTAVAHLRRLAAGHRSLRVLQGVLAGFALVNLLVLSQASLWKKYDPRFYRDRLEVCRSGKWDVVLAGGSPVTSGIDVTQLEGLTWRGKPLEQGFNLGMPLGTIVDVSMAVEQGLERNPPRLLIYGAAPTDFNGNRIEPQGLRYLMFLEDLARWLRHRPDKLTRSLREFIPERLASFIPLAYHGDGLRFWAAHQLGRLHDRFSPATAQKAVKNLDDSQVIQGRVGYLPYGHVYPEGRLGVRKAQGQSEPPFIFLNRYDVQRHLSYLRRLLKWAKANNVEVVLLEMPLAIDVEKAYPKEHEQFRSVLEQVARTHQLPLLRPSREEVGLTDHEYIDLAHLNADGVRLFSAWLRHNLQQMQ